MKTIEERSQRRCSTSQIPRAGHKGARLRTASAQLYFAAIQTVTGEKVDPKSDQLQLLLAGFGVPSSDAEEVLHAEGHGPRDD